MSMTRRGVAFGAALVLLFGAGACGSGDGDSGSNASDDGGPPKGGKPLPPPAATVRLAPTTFQPDRVSIKIGDRVLWKWEGGVQHNVNGGDEFKSDLKAKGEFSHTFDTAGTFEYRCDVHPTTMTGVVEVAAS